MSAIWHAKHVMPKNVTVEQRIARHVDHADHAKTTLVSQLSAEDVERRFEGELGPELGKTRAAQPCEQLANSIIAPSHAFAQNRDKCGNADHQHGARHHRT
jgi:hypothetical protein